MKANIILVSALALAATAIVSNASATQLNGNGVNFESYYNADLAQIDYLPFGVRYTGTGEGTVIASIDHNPPSQGQTIYIDGLHYGPQTSTCTVYSYDYTGIFLTSKTVSASSVSGSWERSVFLDQADSPRWAYYSVICSIPGHGNGVMLGVTAM